MEIMSLFADGLSASTPEQRRQLQEVKSQLQEMQVELKHIRRAAQMNMQSSKDLLRDTFDRISQIVAGNVHA